MPRRRRKNPDPSNPPPYLLQGNRLTIQRQVLGISQGELAEACGVTTASVQQWEYGLTTPRQNKWPKIEAKLLRPRMWFIVGKEGSEIPSGDALGARQAVSLAIRGIRVRLDYLEALTGATAPDEKVEEAGYVKLQAK